MSFAVHHTQIVLGTGIPLFCSKSVPLHRSFIILWNTLSFAVHHTQIVLGTVLASLSTSQKSYNPAEHLVLQYITPSLYHCSAASLYTAVL